MATIEDRLGEVRPKIERAKKHIDDLNTEVRRFLQSNPYKVGVKRDPQSRKLIYYIAAVEPVPKGVALIAGDVIQNLMSALDHLAYQLACAATNGSPPNPNWIYFPIQDDAPKYESKKLGKIQGARQSTIQAIDALKPYKGGNDLLWTLYRLNNVDKHRLLFTVGSQFRSMDIGPVVSRTPMPMFRDKPMPAISLFVRPADTLFPLKVGDELFIDAPDAEFNEDVKFQFDVALSEPQIIKARSLFELFVQLTGVVEGVVTALTPELRDGP